MNESNTMPLQHGAPRNLSKEEVNRVLNQAVLGRIATCSKDIPHVVPIWFYWDGDSLWFETSPKAKKAQNLLKNQRCMVTVDGTQGGLRFWAILLEGFARLIFEPTDYVQKIVTQIYTKYLGSEGVLATQPQAMIKSDHILVQLKPDKIITWDTTHSPILPYR